LVCFFLTDSIVVDFDTLRRLDVRLHGLEVAAI